MQRTRISQLFKVAIEYFFAEILFASAAIIIFTIGLIVSPNNISSIFTLENLTVLTFFALTGVLFFIAGQFAIIYKAVRDANADLRTE